MNDGSWLFAAVILVLVLVVVAATAVLEALLRRILGPRPAEHPRPFVTGTLPVIDGCRECVLAREAGAVVQHRHLLREHDYHVLSDERAAA